MKYSLSASAAIMTAILVASGLAGCDSADYNTVGHVKVYMQDAPLDDFAKANVTITQVLLVGDVDQESGSDTTETYTVFDGSFTADLLTLQNGIDTLLVDADVPAGKYTQLRVVVDPTATVEYTDGTTADLKIPSGNTSGIKIQLPGFEIDSDEDLVELVVDFDLSRSFVSKGNGGYNFKPVIKPVSLVINTAPVPVDTTAATVSAQ